MLAASGQTRLNNKLVQVSTKLIASLAQLQIKTPSRPLQDGGRVTFLAEKKKEASLTLQHRNVSFSN